MGEGKKGFMSENDQQLFLIEFLVDKVNVPTVRAIQHDLLPSTTSVSFQILNLPPINIDENDPLTACACSTDPVSNDERIFKKGKSCLFALPTIALEKPLLAFPVTLSVYKKLPAGVLPDVMLIGSHQIEMKDVMNLLLKDYVFLGGTPSKNIKNTFQIKTATGQPVGSATVFIRASCFGKKIVTQFQVPHNHKPFLFKGSDNSPILQCNKIINNKDYITGKCSAKSTIQSTHDGEQSQTAPAHSPINNSRLTQKCYAAPYEYSNLRSHTHPNVNLPATSENRSKFVVSESPINLKKCGCPKAHT